MVRCWPPHIAPCTCCGQCSPVLQLEKRDAHKVDDWMAWGSDLPPDAAGIAWMHGNAPSAFLSLAGAKVITPHHMILPTYAPGAWAMSDRGGVCSPGAINSHCNQRAICLSYDFRWAEDYSEVTTHPLLLPHMPTCPSASRSA